METGEIFDGSITASSEENDTPAKNGRLNYSAGKSWCAGTQDNNPFLQIDLGTTFVLCAVATQGNSQAEEWVETYQLQTSNDGLNWTDYKEEGRVRVCDEITWPYGLRSMWEKSAPWGWEEAAYPTGNWMRGFCWLCKTMTLFKTKKMSFSYPTDKRKCAYCWLRSRNRVDLCRKPYLQTKM